jgi:hypothetical protein
LNTNRYRRLSAKIEQIMLYAVLLRYFLAYELCYYNDIKLSWLSYRMW